MKLKLTVPFAAGLAGLVATAAMASSIIYSNDFESGAGSFTGAGSVESVVGASGSLEGHSGFSGQFLLNNTGSQGVPASASTVTLSGLAAHTTLDLSFSLGLLSSWDGLNGSPAPDYFNVALDGVTILQTSANNASGTGVIQPAGVSGAELGCFYNCFYNDATFLVDLPGLAHSGSTATLSFFASGNGWQGGSDEFWGIDNVVVSSNTTPPTSAVPLPAGGVLLLGGLGALAALRKRRKA